MLLLTGLYHYTKDLLKMDACWLECPMTLLQYLRQVVTPLHWKEWDHTLGTHPDQQFQRYVVDGIRYGFRLGCTKEPSGGVKKPLRNMPSALERPEVIHDYLAEEYCLGRVMGPLDPALVPTSAHQSVWGNPQRNKWEVAPHSGHVISIGVFGE